MIRMLIAALICALSLTQSVGRLGTGVPKAGGAASDCCPTMTWIGDLKLTDVNNFSQGAGSYGSIAIRYVGGERRILLAGQNGYANWSPSEWIDTAVYSTDGTCTANCPSTTFASAPQLTLKGNWGFPNGTVGAEAAITSISAANPAVVTTSAAHGFSSGDTVHIRATNSSPNIDGFRTITAIDATHFSVPVNVTGAGNVGFGLRVYDFYHGILGKCWGTTDCNTNGSNAFNDCSAYQGGGCLLTMIYVVPGTPDKFFYSFGQSYGAGYHEYSFGFCTLDTTPVVGSVSPASTCYGPFRPRGQGATFSHDVEGNATYWRDNANYMHGGLRSCNFMLPLPGGTYGCTGSEGGAAYAGAFGSAGPFLFKFDALPTTGSDSSSSGPYITASTKYLWYHTMMCQTESDSCNSRRFNFDGSPVAGRDIWAYVHPAWSYMPDGTPCAINADNPVGQPPGCGGASSGPGGTVTQVVGDMFIDPRLNSGKVTWQNLDSMNGGVWYTGTTKSAFFAFVSLATNHLQAQNDITNCTFTPPGGSLQNVAHTTYCNGQYKGASGFTCSGDNDGGYGHPGDVKSPEFQCPFVDIATGPSDTFREPAIVVFALSDLNAVAAGTKADYTVTAQQTIYPLTDMSTTMKFAAPGTNGVARSWGQGGIAVDPNNPHIVYATAPQADTVTNFGDQITVIHVFRISE